VSSVIAAATPVSTGASDLRTAVIVGAGLAGRWLVLTLRAEGFAGRIVWLGDEPHRAYDRPPLSKAVIQGEVPMAQLELMTEAALTEHRVEWRAGDAVTAIDRSQRRVRTRSGSEVGYDLLFLATGGRARTLPGLAQHPRVLTLRTFEDAQQIKQCLANAQRVLVLGGGWIGLEIAASARGLGREVTVIEAAPRLCVRTVPACVSQHLLDLHTGRGVEVLLGDGVQRVMPDAQGVTVQLASGRRLVGDVLIVGIGLVANDALARECGLDADNGVLTDAFGRTSDAAIFAVGDVANSLRADGRRVRLESWENAQRQAVIAARTALGRACDPEADGPPWFWSDQFDDNLQLLGVPGDGLRMIERQVPAKRQRLFFFCDGGRVRAVAAVNAGRDVKVVRKWIAQDRFPALDSLVDASADLNKLPLAPAGG
jgi:3-phenylpropionate/trans-cinnamate dioxygenase ferredoxin reductase component